MRGEGKKLAQVARIQARGQLTLQGSTNDPDADYDEALAAFGLQEVDSDAVSGDSVIASEARQSMPSDYCYLWPENVQTFIIWQNLQTQWRFASNGKAIGLHYAGVRAYLQIIDPENVKEIFTGLQAMEFAALAAFREQPQE